MIKNKQVNVRTTKLVLEKFDRLALENDRTKGYYHSKALEAYVSNDVIAPLAIEKAVIVPPVAAKPVKVKPSINIEIPALVLIELSRRLKDSNSRSRGYSTTPANCKDINSRIAEGSTLDDFMYVVSIKCDEWLGTDQAKYLRPSTLFNGKQFSGYLNQVRGGTSNVKRSLAETSEEQSRYILAQLATGGAHNSLMEQDVTTIPAQMGEVRGAATERENEIQLELPTLVSQDGSPNR